MPLMSLPASREVRNSSRDAPVEAEEDEGIAGGRFVAQF